MNKKDWILKELKKNEKLNDPKLRLTFEKLIKEEDLKILKSDELFLIDVTLENEYEEYCDPNYGFEVYHYTDENNLNGIRFYFDSFTDENEYFPTIMMFKIEHLSTKSIEKNDYKKFKEDNLKLHNLEYNEKILNEIRAFENERDYYEAEIKKLKNKLKKTEE